MKMSYNIHIAIPEDFQQIVDEVTEKYSYQKVTEKTLQDIRKEIVEKLKDSISIVVEQDTVV